MVIDRFEDASHVRAWSPCCQRRNRRTRSHRSWHRGSHGRRSRKSTDLLRRSRPAVRQRPFGWLSFWLRNIARIAELIVRHACLAKVFHQLLVAAIRFAIGERRPNPRVATRAVRRQKPKCMRVPIGLGLSLQRRATGQHGNQQRQPRCDSGHAERTQHEHRPQGMFEMEYQQLYDSIRRLTGRRPAGKDWQVRANEAIMASAAKDKP